MPTAAPAFLFYPRDYLADPRVLAMTFEERGVYWHLCCLYWTGHGLPNDPAALARLLQLKPKKFDHAWITIAKFFECTGPVLVHAALDEARAKQHDYLNKCALGGRRGAARRWAPPNGGVNRESFPSDDSLLTLQLQLRKEQEHEELRLPAPSPCGQPVEKSNVPVLLRLSHELDNQTFDTYADYNDALKTLAAQHGLDTRDVPKVIRLRSAGHPAPLQIGAPALPVPGRRRA